MFLRRVGFAVLVAVLGVGAVVDGQTSEIASDSPPQTGALPNGIRYIVMPHSSPKGDIGLRLMVQAGSLDERDDQRGFAHFVEHMAFNGTRRMPPGSIRQFFQNLGLTFGADINANTGYTFTTYLLDLPDGRSAEVDRTLAVLRDYADGLLFPPDEVAREAPVVLSELNARDSAGRRLTTQFIDVLYKGTALPDREIGGLPKLLQQATSDQLRGFYTAHYQPDRMTVVLVGALDPRAAVEKIEAAFGSLTPPTEKRPAAAVPRPPSVAGVKADVVTSPSSKGSAIQLVHIGVRPPDTVEGRRQELVQRLATAALYSRVRAARERGDITRFAPPQVRYEPTPFGNLVQHSLELGCTPRAWDSAIELLETELRRASTMGFTPTEIEEAVAGQLTYARNRVAEFGGSPAARVAAEITRHVVNGRTWRTPKEELAETAQALESVEAAEVTAELSRIFPRDSLHIVLIASPDNVVKSDRLIAAYSKSAGRNLRGNQAAEEALRFQYESFGTPGAVAKEEHIADLDLTLITFANGARLNLRPTTFEPGRFRLRVVFPQNYADVPVDAGGVSDLAGQIFLSSDLRKHNQTEIGRLLKLRGVNPQFTVNNGTPIFTLQGPTGELAFGLQFLTALLSNLELDQDHYRVSLSRYSAQHQSMMSTPAILALRAALIAYTDNDRRVAKNPPQLFANEAGRDKAEGWLQEYILRGGLEIGIVGDFSVQDAKTFAAASIGTLERRRIPKASRPLSSPTKAQRIEGSAELPASTSMSCALWPVTLPDTARSHAALALAADVLKDRAQLYLREMLGATYSPDVRVYRDAVQRDFAYVAMINTFESGQSQKLNVTGLSIAAHLAEKGVMPEEFQRLREPARNRRAQDLRNNAWWVNAVATAQRRPGVLDEIRRHESVFEEITLADVNEAAQVFKPNRFTSVLLHPASAKIPPVKSRGKQSAPKKGS
jgi:zinc protease